MTELTPQEILDAIRRGLEETWRRLDAGKADQTAPQLSELRENVKERVSSANRRS